MRKIKIFIILLSSLFYLCSCNKENNEEICTHPLGEWQYDDNIHWREYACTHLTPEQAKEHLWDDGTEISSDYNFSESEYTCTVCGYKKISISNEILSLAKQDAQKEIEKYKNLIIFDVEKNLQDSINEIINNYLSEISIATSISGINSLHFECINDINNLIPKASGLLDFSTLSDNEINKILNLLDEFIFRNNLAGVPINKYRALNLNSTTKAQWQQLFGENGSIKQTNVQNYWNVKPFLSNGYFIKGLNLCLNKDLITDLQTNSLIDFSDYEYYDYNIDLARKYFKLALTQMIEERIYDISSINNPIELKLEIAFGSKTEDNEKAFNIIRNFIETAFNDFRVTNNKFVIKVEAWYGEIFGEIFTKKNYNGQFDLSYDIISSSNFDPYMSYRLLSSTAEISNDLTTNWSIITSKLENDCIVYNGYRFSYDAILELLYSERMIIEGRLMPKLNEDIYFNIVECKGKPISGVYLGQYKGYYIWFSGSLAQAVETKIIGEYTFTYNTSFNLFAYKNEITTVNNLYSNGQLTKEDIKEIFEYFTYVKMYKLYSSYDLYKMYYLKNN